MQKNFDSVPRGIHSHMYACTNMYKYIIDG